MKNKQDIDQYMRDNGKFYKIDEVWDLLTIEHKKAIEWYTNNPSKLDNQTKIEED